MVSQTIELHEVVEVPEDRARAWVLVTDPDTVAACFPGAAITGADEDGWLNGTVRLKLGPTEVLFQGRVLVEYDHDRHRGRLTARGGDRGGRTRAAATASFELVDAADGRPTTLHVRSTVEVAGALAPFLHAGGAHLAQQLLRDFSANLAGLAQPDRGAAVAEGSGDSVAPEGASPIRGFRYALRAFWAYVRKLVGRARPQG